MQDLQPTHFSGFASMGPGCLTYLSRAHGRREIITDGSFAASSSLSALSQAARSYGSTICTRRMPTAWHRASKSIFVHGSPLRLKPVVGFCWCPVMPVMELSRMITVEVDSLYAMLMSPVTPECINVESPMTATVRAAFFSPEALLNPCRPETDAPMQIVVSIACNGAAAPSVS